MLLLLFAFALAIANAWYDYRIISQGRSPDHVKEAFVRGMLILGLALILNGSWVLILLRFVAGAAAFWIVFELALNKLRGLKLLYVGENAKTDIFFRKLFPKNPGTAMLVVKLIILNLSLCLLVLMQVLSGKG